MADRGRGSGEGWDTELPLVPPTEWGPARELRTRSTVDHGSGPGGSGPLGAGPPGTGPGGRRSRRAPVTAIVVALVVVAGAVGISVVVVDQFNQSRSSAAPPRTAPSTTPTTDPPTTATTLVAPDLLAALKGRVPSPVPLDDAMCTGMLRAGTFEGQDLRLWHPGNAEELPIPTEDDVRGEISTVMRRRYAAADPEGAVVAGLGLFDSRRLREVTGDEPALRGALVELMGTFAEPALRYVLTTDVPMTIHYGMPTVEQANGQAFVAADGFDIIVKRSFQHERAILQTPIVFHEILHLGGQTERTEEVVNNVLDMRLAFAVARDFPEVFLTNTQGTKELRWMIEPQLNTRSGNALTVTHSDVPTIYPNTIGPPVPDLVALILGPDPDGTPSPYVDTPEGSSPGHPTLEAVLRDLADDGSNTSGMQFDDATIAFLDSHPGVPACDQWVAAVASGATPTKSTAARAARTWLDQLPT